MPKNTPQPSLRDQFAVARKLIDERHYDEALALLKTIDHPTARQWQARIRRQQGRGERMTLNLALALVAVLVIAVVMLGALLLAQTLQDDAQGEALIAVVGTWSAAQTVGARYAVDEAGGRATLDALRALDAAGLVGTLETAAAVRTQTSLDAQATLAAAQRLRLGGIDSPIPAGDRIEVEMGFLRVVSVERPVSYVLFRDEQLARPQPGSGFVGVQIEFTCRPTAERCATPPEAALTLRLSDGAILPEDAGLAVRDAALLSGQPISGGAAVRGWRFYEVPLGVELLLRVSTPLLSEGVFASLPPALDGCALETPWTTLEDGSRQRRLPSARCALEAAGFTLDEAILRQPAGQGATLALAFPLDLVSFSDEASVWAAAGDFLRAAAAAWGGARDLAPNGLAVRLYNPRAGLELGSLGVSGSDLLAYLSGALDDAAFQARWIVVID
jgi:hypothetical protein